MAISFASCSYTISEHQWGYHGSDALLNTRSFVYVERGLIGKATTTYTWRGGGDIRSGLVADAMRDLSTRNPLGPNQQYCNITIDQTNTESGVRTPLLLAFFTGDIAYLAEEFEISVTIRADIIQFVDSNGQILIDSTQPKIEPAVSSIAPQTSQKKDDIVPVTTNQNLVICEYELGDIVRFKRNKQMFTGVVIERTSPTEYSEATYKCSYLDDDKERTIIKRESDLELESRGQQ